MPKAHSAKQSHRLKSDEGLLPLLRRDLFENPWRFLCFILAGAAVIYAWDSGVQVACIDYYQFWTVGKVIRQDRAANIYSPPERQRLGEMMWQKVEARVGTDPNAQGASKQYQAGAQRQILETYSTPFLYALFGITSTDDYDRDQDRFQLFSLACMVFGIALLCRGAGYSPAACAIAISFFAAAFGPTISDMSVGNVSRVQVALIVLFLWLQAGRPSPVRWLMAGFILGLAVLFKPNLFFVALIVVMGWAFSRQYSKVLWQCVGIVVGALSGLGCSLVYGASWRSWLHWAAELPRLTTEYDAPVSKGNFALAKVVEETIGLDFSVVIAIVILAGALIVIWRWGRSGMSGASPVDDMRLTALGCLVSLLMARLAWLHYYVLGIIPILYLLRPATQAVGMDEGGRRFATNALAVAATVMVAANSVRIPAAFRPETATLAFTTSAGALLLLVLVLLDFPLRRAFDH